MESPLVRRASVAINTIGNTVDTLIDGSTVDGAGGVNTVATEAADIEASPSQRFFCGHRLWRCRLRRARVRAIPSRTRPRPRLSTAASSPPVPAEMFRWRPAIIRDSRQCGLGSGHCGDQRGGGLRCRGSRGGRQLHCQFRPGQLSMARPLIRARSEPRCVFRRQHFHHRRGRRAFVYRRRRGGRYRFRRAGFRAAGGRWSGPTPSWPRSRTAALSPAATAERGESHRNRSIEDYRCRRDPGGPWGSGRRGWRGWSGCVGVSVASNEIGIAATPIPLKPFIDNSSVTGDGGVNLTATSAAKIWVLTIAGSAAGAGREGGGIALCWRLCRFRQLHS